MGMTRRPKQRMLGKKKNLWREREKIVLGNYIITSTGFK